MRFRVQSGRRAQSGRVAIGALAVVALLVAAGCDPLVVNQVAKDRAAAGRAPVTSSATLNASALAHAQQNCNARAATDSADPYAEFDAESIKAADDLSGAAVLDPSITDPIQRDVAATNAVIAGWAGNPITTDARWNNLGVGSVHCPDGKLYYSAAFTQDPTMPSSGRYSTDIYSADQITRTSNLQYGTAVDYLGVNTNLLLDVWTPPTDAVTARPLLVLIHGGAFAGGSRSEYQGIAVEFARKGFVVASADYRLRPTGDANRALLGARDGIDDVMEAVRWLKAHSATYGIDTTRIATEGNSAGAVIALGVALADDPTPGGPLAAYTPTVEAAVSTGGTLTQGLSQLTLSADDPTINMYNYENDPTEVGAADDAFKTCAAVRASGNTCDFTELPGDGHTTDLSSTGPYWTTDIGPFLSQHLNLAP